MITTNFSPPQPIDTKYINPSLDIPHVNISTKECNPHLDIKTNHPTIQITLTLAHIYDETGTHVGILTIKRLEWLWMQYNKHKNNNTLLQPPPQDFPTEILWMFHRYITHLPRKPKKTANINAHQSIPTYIINHLQCQLDLTHSYFSSPLTCNTNFTQYNSPHQ